MNSIDITVLAIVVGVLLLVFILCGCNNRKKILNQATRIFPSDQQSNNPAAAPAAGRGRRHRRRGGRSERASETYPVGSNNANVFVISIDDAPPPEYKWEELPPPSYEDAIKIASLQQQDSVLLTQST